MNLLFFITLANISQISSMPDTKEDLNGIKGNAFRINEEKRSFELIKETYYDPQTNEGQSRHSVYWNENTKFIKVDTQNTFTGMNKKFFISFTPKGDHQKKAMLKGEFFKSKFSKVFYYETNRKEGIADDENSISGWFEPDSEDSKQGILKYGDKSQKVRLSGPYAQIAIHQDSTADEFTKGFWKTKVYGSYENKVFTINKLIAYPRKDPRLTDDPKLPRVLVIGDSISMNYHRSTKEELKGIANYHRIDENGGPAERGVVCSELWLGDYLQKGFQWDLIQFNHGLHDLIRPYDEKTKEWGKHRFTLDEYKKNLLTVIKILKQSGAKLMWCDTSPIPNSRLASYGRKNGDALIFNNAAKEVLKDYPEILINPLHKSISDDSALDKWRTGDDVHFWGHDQQDIVGKYVANAIKKALNSSE